MPSAGRVFLIAAVVLVVALAVGVWGMTGGDTAARVLGAGALIAGVGFSALLFWNGIRLGRGDQPPI